MPPSALPTRIFLEISTNHPFISRVSQRTACDAKVAATGSRWMAPPIRDAPPNAVVPTTLMRTT